MRRSKSVNSVDFLIHNFQCSVCKAHERLAYEVDAVAHVTLLDIHRKIFVDKFDPSERRMVASPVTTSKSVEAMQLMEYGEC